LPLSVAADRVIGVFDDLSSVTVALREKNSDELPVI